MSKPDVINIIHNQVMPIYEYYCKICGYEFEKRQSINESPLNQCTQCGRNSLERKISVPNIFIRRSAEKSGKIMSRVTPKSGPFSIDASCGAINFRHPTIGARRIIELSENNKKDSNVS